MKRRQFLRQTGLASTALFTPAFLRSSAMASATELASRSGKILIVLQLSGGNDGLNTVVPYGDDLYYANRPLLGIPAKEVITLNDHQGFHPALAPLRELYDRGEMTIINGVGYPNPDRSHFRSMDIWQTGSPATENWSTGWIGRYLDESGNDKPVYHALEVDDGLSLAMKGNTRSGFAMSQPARLRRAVKNERLNQLGHAHAPADSPLAYLYKTLTETTEAAAYLLEQSRVRTSTAEYPAGAFGRDLKQIAELITADTATNIYYASLGGFDTHVGQRNRQERLLSQYAQATAALVRDLKAHDLFKDVVIMTFSEFGRRLKQNASGGTDHGTANNLFLMGGQLKKAGLYNDAPRLDTLDAGDLIHQVDFRSCYATLIDDWLEGDSERVLGRKFASLGIV